VDESRVAGLRADKEFKAFGDLAQRRLIDAQETRPLAVRVSVCVFSFFFHFFSFSA
jgi:hypothetical protein